MVYLLLKKKLFIHVIEPEVDSISGKNRLHVIEQETADCL